MIDLGLSKIAIIGVIALVVLGPERLPKVARTVGTLLGRAQRYIAEVKSEVSREMDLEELRKMQSTVREAAQGFESTVQDELLKTSADLKAAFDPYADARLIEGLPPLPDGASAAAPRRKKNWRIRQSATPVWFRQVSRKRTRVLSGAARVARYRFKGTGGNV